MAYVAISNSLLADIRRKISTMQNQETALHILPNLPPPDPDSLALAEAHLWGANKHLQAVVPQEWLRKVHNVKFVATVVDDDGNLIDRVSISWSTDLVGPPAHPDYTLDYYSSTDKAALNMAVDSAFAPIAPLIEHRKQKAEIERRWRKISDDVMAFLGKCKSLNEALKLWPDLRIYVPEDVLKRMEEKRATKKDSSAALAALSKIDTAGAVSAAVGLTLQQAASMENI